MPRNRDLQIYINMEDTAASGVFYSRRGKGPFYRWHYDDAGRRWYSARLHIKSVPMSFHIVGQKAIPAELRTALEEHYQD